MNKTFNKLNNIIIKIIINHFNLVIIKKTFNILIFIIKKVSNSKHEKKDFKKKSN